MGQVMRAGFVQIEDGPVFPCMLADEDWNGFSVPYFSPRVARAVLSAYASDYAPSWHGEVLVMWDSSDLEDSERERIIVDFTSVNWEPHYGIGAGSWIWTEVTG